MAERETNSADNKPRSTLLPKIFVAAFVVAVILVQCLLAYWLIPSPAEVAQAASAAEQQKTPAQDEEKSAKSNQAESVIEVDLGTFDITIYQPASKSTWRVNIAMAGTIRKKDKAEFESLYANNQHRLRDRIITVVRNSQIDELTDGHLGLIKRRILEKSNDLFGKPLLVEINFSHYQFIER